MARRGGRGQGHALGEARAGEAVPDGEPAPLHAPANTLGPAASLARDPPPPPPPPPPLQASTLPFMFPPPTPCPWHLKIIWYWAMQASGATTLRGQGTA